MKKIMLLVAVMGLAPLCWADQSKEQIDDRLQKAADQKGMSVQDLGRTAVEFYLLCHEARKAGDKIGIVHPDGATEIVVGLV